MRDITCNRRLFSCKAEKPPKAAPFCALFLHCSKPSVYHRGLLSSHSYRGGTISNAASAALRREGFCMPSACRDAPLGQRQGGVFRLPPPYLWTPPTPQRNNCDRRQRRKQGAVVGAAASKTRVPPKARSGCWVPQPVAKGCSPLTILKKKSKHKKASAAPVGASALTLFSLLHL